MAASFADIAPVDLLPERPLTLIDYIAERIQPFRISASFSFFLASRLLISL
jgi:hypothetical protein